MPRGIAAKSDRPIIKFFIEMYLHLEMELLEETELYPDTYFALIVPSPSDRNHKGV